MLSGLTVMPPAAIGPPQPTPIADRVGEPGRDGLLDHARQVVEELSRRPRRGVGWTWRLYTSPSSVTIAEASFVPPMSTATTGPHVIGSPTMRRP